MKKFLKYYLGFIIAILVILFSDNFIGLLILGVLLIVHHEKIIEVMKKIIKKE